METRGAQNYENVHGEVSLSKHELWPVSQSFAWPSGSEREWEGSLAKCFALLEETDVAAPVPMNIRVNSVTPKIGFSGHGRFSLCGEVVVEPS